MLRVLSNIEVSVNVSDIDFEDATLELAVQNDKIKLRMIAYGPKDSVINFASIGELENTDFVMKSSFFLGTYPGIDMDKIVYITQCIEQFIEMRK